MRAEGRLATWRRSERSSFFVSLLFFLAGAADTLCIANGNTWRNACCSTLVAPKSSTSSLRAQRCCSDAWRLPRVAVPLSELKGREAARSHEGEPRDCSQKSPRSAFCSGTGKETKEGVTVEKYRGKCGVLASATGTTSPRKEGSTSGAHPDSPCEPSEEVTRQRGRKNPSEEYLVRRAAVPAALPSAWRWFFWKPRYSRRSIEEKLSCVPVYVVVNRFGAPFLSSPPVALFHRLEALYGGVKEDNQILPQQVALAFLNGDDARNYLHELVQSNVGGAQVEARLYCLPLSAIWEQQRRLLLETSKEDPDEEKKKKSSWLWRRAAGKWRGTYQEETEVELERIEEEKEKERAAREAAQPQLLWRIVPDKKEIRNARLYASLSELHAAKRATIPVFYSPELLVIRDGESILPLFFSLADLHAAWPHGKRNRNFRRKRSKAGAREEDDASAKEEDPSRPVKVVNLVHLLAKQADLAAEGHALAGGRWGFVPSSASLQFLEKEKRKGTAPARLLFSIDDGTA
ncbi:tic22-like family protein [Cystoisospora suis]|uniref:Tic22-like family protein n=1 Tax=Cystoisospora suis TaxID=483139 RepID=A0A2C6JZ47_9APIC|nr:tic22-like family protein [Cystoisospora suis]